MQEGKADSSQVRGDQASGRCWERGEGDTREHKRCTPGARGGRGGGGGGGRSTYLKCSQLASLQLAQPLCWPELLRASKEIQPSAQPKLDHVAYPVTNA